MIKKTSYLLLIYLININNNILSMQKKHVRHISIENTKESYSINNDFNNNDYVIKFTEKNKFENDSLENINFINKKKKFSKLKIASYICDGSYKIINMSFIAAVAILGYYLILNLSSGCDTMHTACNQCTYNLKNAEDTINLVKNFTNLISNILKVCPKGKEDIINGFTQFFKDCC